MELNQQWKLLVSTLWGAEGLYNSNNAMFVKSINIDSISIADKTDFYGDAI